MTASAVACQTASDALRGDDGRRTAARAYAAPAVSADGSAVDVSLPPATEGSAIAVRPNRLYSAFDGEHAFTVPVAVYDAASDLTLTADDGEALVVRKAELEAAGSPEGMADDGRYFLLTTRKPGTFVLTARSRGRSATATVTVTAYAPSRFDLGYRRYANNNVAKSPQRACTTCHLDGAGIDHSPASLASLDEQAVALAITSGVRSTPVGPSVIQTGEPGTLHQWAVEPAVDSAGAGASTGTSPELEGLIVYLRALSPRGFRTLGP